MNATDDSAACAHLVLAAGLFAAASRYAEGRYFSN